MILHQRKKPKGSEIQPVPLKLRRGDINWEPPFPEGEDELSLKGHKEWLQSEAKRRNPDWEKVEKNMALTFSDRRKLMNQKIELKEVRAQYPALFNFQQVLILLLQVVYLNNKLITAAKSCDFFSFSIID